ncbi:MAG: sulfate adenylyltransferase subunit 1 [Actinomycetales bacterium]
MAVVNTVPNGRGAPAETQAAPILRLVISGSVDDGKSTLIGRLLYDSKQILTDQLEALRLASERRNGGRALDLSLLTDGLRAEREQGITIDVAYRYFSTRSRSFVLADTPGHVQYTRNMVTGASDAELAVILVDARKGVVEQTRRHAAVAALLRVPHVVVAVNKMDLVADQQAVYAGVTSDVQCLAAQLGLSDVVTIPVSALRGDNVVDRSGAMPWYDGPTLLEHLEHVPAGTRAQEQPFRLPVQVVLRAGPEVDPDYRGYAGQVVSGTVTVGQEVVVLPSPGRHTARVVGIDGLHGPQDLAVAQESVTLRLDRELDIARGDLLAAVEDQPVVTQELEAVVCWLDEREAHAGERLLLQSGTRVVRARLEQVVDRLDIETLEHVPAECVGLNDLATVRLRLAEPVAVDDYARLRGTGAFLLVQPDDGATLAAGMVGRR